MEKDLSLRTSFPVEDVPFSLVPDGESGAWILTGKALRRYDANGNVTESRGTPDGVTRLWFSENTLYCEAAKGLFAWEGNGWSLKVDYAAADIVPQNSVLLMVRSDGETLYSLSDGEKRILWNYRMTDEDGGDGGSGSGFLARTAGGDQEDHREFQPDAPGHSYQCHRLPGRIRRGPAPSRVRRRSAS